MPRSTPILGDCPMLGFDCPMLGFCPMVRLPVLGFDYPILGFDWPVLGSVCPVLDFQAAYTRFRLPYAPEFRLPNLLSFRLPYTRFLLPMPQVSTAMLGSGCLCWFVQHMAEFLDYPILGFHCARVRSAYDLLDCPATRGFCLYKVSTALLGSSLSYAQVSTVLYKSRLLYTRVSGAYTRFSTAYTKISSPFILEFRLPYTRIYILGFDCLYTRFRLPILGFRLPYARFRLLGFRLPILKFRLPYTRFRLPYTRFDCPILEFDCSILEFRLPYAEFRLPYTRVSIAPHYKRSLSMFIGVSAAYELSCPILGSLPCSSRVSTGLLLGSVCPMEFRLPYARFHCPVQVSTPL
ncbi:hypothetical protein AVEN_86092-1 [Araneus ventricosus]|uniref:Uncharacterized protein n=1 Tax=Araneus ventricosus TaxID=182803 RepID=A0A4Y2LDE9_ARAVE|nr:hypothetical protein AVEN_86092-1 [Araneus ventricosus]